ncbi:MAG: hypothetical protein U1A27_06665 [Phycisphaerae bacterium]
MQNGVGTFLDNLAKVVGLLQSVLGLAGNLFSLVMDLLAPLLSLIQLPGGTS